MIALLDRALIVPVLTAHPTEVMRKSMLDHRNRIAALMRLRDAGRTETPEGELIEEAIARRSACCGRRGRCGASGSMSPMKSIFPRPTCAIFSSGRCRCSMRDGNDARQRPPSFLRPGSWIGGDRDGNPHVTADSLRLALSAPSKALLTRLSGADQSLGAELSFSSELRRCRPAWMQLGAGRAAM